MNPDEPQPSSNPPRWLLIAFGLAALALAAALLFYAYSRANRDESLQSIPAFEGTAESGVAPLAAGGGELVEAGSVAPDFELPDVNGDMVRLSDFAGRPVILNFWATWCAPCRVEMPALQEAQAEFGDDGPVVLTINQEESAERVTEFFDEVGLTLPALLDAEAEVGMAYSAIFLPTTVIVGPDGIVSAVHRGVISREEVDGYLGQLAATDG